MKKTVVCVLTLLVLLFIFPLRARFFLFADSNSSTSDSIPVGANGPEQMLRRVADDLDAGNIAEAKKHFSRDYPFEKMTPAGRKLFADFYRNCKAKGYTGRTWIYNVPMQVPGGQTVDQEVVIARQGSDDWVIVN